MIRCEPRTRASLTVTLLLVLAGVPGSVGLAQGAAGDEPGAHAAPQPPTGGVTPPSTAAGEDPASDGDRGAGVVVGVIDGDTIEVEGFGRVRLLGVDAPESVDPRREVQPFGRAAADYTRARLLGRRVRLELDPIRRRDRYGRTLAYVFLPDGTLFNELLLRDGFAHVYTGHPFARMDAFRQAQREARRAGRGLWGPPAASSASPAPAAAAAAGSRSAAACEPSYPDLCVPPPPPDLDCADVPARRFRVAGTDPHRFDGDRDGIGCER